MGDDGFEIRWRDQHIEELVDRFQFWQNAAFWLAVLCVVLAVGLGLALAHHI